MTPDTDMWAAIADFVSFLGAVEAVTLLACVAGLVLSALAWAGGRVAGMPGISAAGKVGVGVSILSAFCIPVVPRMIDWIIHTLSA
ncbi:hypothetical protein [Actinomyces israelii]|uniref:hypothetical protein n=1 Tax=Actinomyces israelii TaxID=1659 RepID=UPI0012EBAAD4|nr:hypothetical protein [Actinomyces israelii]